VDKELIKARDNYVKAQSRELFFSMNETKVPKGVKFSVFVMCLPLFMSTSYLSILIPLIETAEVGSEINPENFAFTARSCLRLLNLNLAFTGGVHYGLGAAVYETAASE
jgi:hypothetical protein